MCHKTTLTLVKSDRSDWSTLMTHLKYFQLRISTPREAIRFGKIIHQPKENLVVRGPSRQVGQSLSCPLSGSLIIGLVWKLLKLFKHYLFVTEISYKSSTNTESSTTTTTTTTTSSGGWIEVYRIFPKAESRTNKLQTTKKFHHVSKKHVIYRIKISPQKIGSIIYYIFPWYILRFLGFPPCFFSNTKKPNRAFNVWFPLVGLNPTLMAITNTPPLEMPIAFGFDFRPMGFGDGEIRFGFFFGVSFEGFFFGRGDLFFFWKGLVGSSKHMATNLG